MNNSVFGAPGVFGGPSIFGAHELDPMFAASNPAHSSVFSNPQMAVKKPRKKATVKGKVKLGGGRRTDARELFAEKAVDAWKKGDFAAARKHMKSYDNQKGTRLGLQKKARQHLNNPVRESQFLDWVKRNYGVLGGEKTNRVLGIERSKAVSGRKKMPRSKLVKVAGAAAAAAPQSGLTPGFNHRQIVQGRLSRFGGQKRHAALLGGPRVAGLLKLPAHLRKERLSRMAGPMRRMRQRRKAGMAFLPVAQALPQMKGLPRDQYRVKRNQMLVDRTVEQVLEQLKADPNFINMTYEQKVAAAIPVAEAVDAEIMAVEAEADIQPPLPQEEEYAIAEMSAEADAAADWESELMDEDFDFDDDFDLDDEFAGVFGSFGADDTAASRTEAAATAAVDAIEADVAATEAAAVAMVEDEEGDRNKKYLMYAAAGLAAYWLLFRR